MFKTAITTILVVLVASVAYGQHNIFNNINNQHLKFNDVLIQQKKVEFDAEYFLGLDGYYTLVDEIEFAKAQRQTVERLREEEGRLKKQEEERVKDRELLNTLIKQNAQLIKILAEGGVTIKPVPLPEPDETPIEPTPITPEPEPEVNPEPEPITPTPVKPVDEQSATELDKKVFALFTKSRGGCVNCHGNETQEGGLQLVGEDGGRKWLLNANLADRVLIYDRVANIDLKKRGLKAMPVGGPLFNEEEVSVVRQWMSEEAEKSKNR